MPATETQQYIESAVIVEIQGKLVDFMRELIDGGYPEHKSEYACLKYEEFEGFDFLI